MIWNIPQTKSLSKRTKCRMRNAGEILHQICEANIAVDPRALHDGQIGISLRISQAGPDMKQTAIIQCDPIHLSVS